MKNSLFIIILCGFMWTTGCSTNSIPTELLQLSYIDEKALQNPEQELTYSEIDGEYVHDFIDENKDKAVRWTATVILWIMTGHSSYRNRYCQQYLLLFRMHHRSPSKWGIS